MKTLTDGEKQIWLDTRKLLDLEADSPELEAELLKAIEGPFTPYSSQEMRSIGKRIIKEKIFYRASHEMLDAVRLMRYPTNRR